MPDEKIERRIGLKFPVKLGESATESFRSLTDVYGDDVVSRDHGFSSGTNDSPREGRDDLLIVFFDIKSVIIIMTERGCVEDCLLIKHYYPRVLTRTE